MSMKKLVFLLSLVLMMLAGVRYMDREQTEGIILTDSDLNKPGAAFIDTNVQLPDTSTLTDTSPPDTSAPIDTSPPDTSAPVDTSPPETSAPIDISPPDTSAPVDTSLPETDPPAEKTPQTDTVFWVKNGEVWHLSDKCPSLSRSKNILSGEISAAISAGKARACKRCAA